MNYKGVEIIENTTISDVLGRKTDVLDFSKTETRTHKIIKAREAFKRCPGTTELVAITSGNYGAALKIVAEETCRKVWLIMGKSKATQAERFKGEFSDVEFIENLRGRFPERHTLCMLLDTGIITDLSNRVLEDAFAALKGRDANEFTNVTSHVDIRSNQGRCGNGEHSSLIDYPIYDLLGVIRDRYSAVFVPTGGGELLHDVAVRFMFEPTLVFGVSPMGHPSITGTSFKPENFITSFADKLVCPTHQMGGALRTLREISRGGIQYLDATEDEFKRAYKLAQDAKLNCEPSGAAACVILLNSFRKKHGIQLPKNQKVLIVNTGNGKLCV